jgi:integrase
MSKIRLTDPFVRGLKPAPKAKVREYYDDLVPGFLIRVTDTGHRTYYVQAYWPGKRYSSRKAIGDARKISLARAREIAAQWVATLAEGIDPQEKAETERREAERARATTFAAVAELYITSVVATSRRAKQTERLIRRGLIPELGDIPIKQISRADILKILNAKVERGTPFAARALFSRVRALFNWAIDFGEFDLLHSPVDRMRSSRIMGNRKLARTRILNDKELRAFWNAASQLGYPYKHTYHLLALTGLRRNEVGGARWGEFDLKTKTWIVPEARMKTGNAHLVPLTDDMLSMLNTIPKFDKGDYLFSVTNGVSPVNNFAQARTRLDKRMPEETGPWVLHDIRRTVRTNLSGLPIEEHVRELVLAHKRSGIAGVYDLYEYQDEKRAALVLWNDRLRAIVAAG